MLRVKPKLLQSHWCFTQLIKAAKSYTVSWDRGGLGIADNTSVLSSFGVIEEVGFQTELFCSSMWISYSWGSYKPFQKHQHPEVTSFLLCCFHFVFKLGKGQEKNPNTVSRTLTLFKQEGKSFSFLVNKIKSIFSTAHFSHFPASSPRTFLASSLRELFYFCAKSSNQS